MGRRMTSKDRREQILQGAMRLFAEKGFRGTTTREIAQKLRISEALMFKHFPSKEALYRAIIQQRMNGAKDMLFPKEALKAKDDRQVFSAMASYLIRRNTEDPTFLRLVLYSALEEYDLSKIFFKNNAIKNTKILPTIFSSGFTKRPLKESIPFSPLVRLSEWSCITYNPRKFTEWAIYSIFPRKWLWKPLSTAF